MKVAFCLSLGIILSVNALSQNWNEFFRQKRTQIQYHLRQIAALQVYIELGQKGYGIYQDGLDLIGNIKDGEFTLHKNYFASLSNVNPRVSRSANVDEVFLWNEQVIILRNRVRQMQLGPSKPSLERLFEQLVRKSADNREDMALLITDGNYQLTDEERMVQIKKLHTAECQLYGFAKTTYQDALAYSKQRSKEEKEIKVIKQLEGLP